MFKTIEECRLELVGHTVLVDHDPDEYDPTTYYPNADYMPASAARASFGNEDKTGEDVGKDVKLMGYLADHKHMTPFEYQHATFLVECPLFIRSQIHRHRTFSFNEISRRYTSENLEFWVPTKMRKQAEKNKQASIDESVEHGDGRLLEMQTHCNMSMELYEDMLEYGVAREIARAVLPQSLITRFYMGGVLRNWAHFIELRRDEHAQYEVQVVANRIADKLRELWPESCRALGI